MPAHSLQVTLASRSEERLAAVRDAIRAVTATPCTVKLTTLSREDLRAAARESDVILIQARVGGYTGRRHDESFPLAHSVCGDEGLGPGGFSAAWRTWPFLRDVLQAVDESRSAPRILLLTSPTGLLVRCAKAAFPAADIVGVCELPWVTLREVLDRSDADLAKTHFQYAGVNHLGWFTSITAGERDLISAYAETRDSKTFPTKQQILTSSAIPLKYLRLHYDADETLREQRAATPRAAQLERVQQAAYPAFRTGDRERIAAVLRLRPAPWYEHAIVHLIAPVDETRSITIFLTTTNDGYLPWLADDDIVEIPYRLTVSGLVRHDPVDVIPANIRLILDALIRYEADAARAIVRQDVSAIAPALRLHPWVPDALTAQRLAEHVS